MREAISLARKGSGTVHPNPLVGALLVRNGAIVGSGWHRRAGGPHAEVEAIESARDSGLADLSDCTLYVTLEPCCHHGRTPPCADLVVSSGIRRVVAGMTDPNPRVRGNGFARLKECGIAVTEGILEDECRELNRVFIKYITTGRPYVLLKAAISLDGKTAASTGESKWISCPESRAESRRERSAYTGILCGIGTVLADDPLLGADIQPVRIIADSRLRIPLDSQIVRTAGSIPTIVVAASNAQGSSQKAESGEPDGKTATPEKRRLLTEAGVSVIEVPERNGRADLGELMDCLGRRGIDSVFCEGGGTLAFSALEAGIVDRVRFYVAPILIGGSSSPTALGGAGFSTLADAGHLAGLTIRRCGRDIVAEGDVCLPA
jgi:diaminohydroxyphosphoribosylaminopyrimidine deaminase/5-amino-6-(5-phosphoribosylamino)uracil reductase